MVAEDIEGDALTYRIVDDPTNGTLAPAHGTLTVDSKGHYIYTPDLHYVGEDSFTFVANDGQADSDLATVHDPFLTDVVRAEEVRAVRALSGRPLSACAS